MTTYTIILHSPMGPRRGTLTLPGGSGGARITLLGYDSSLTAEEPTPGHCRLTGQLRSVMGPIAFAAELDTGGGSFACTARTGKGDMRLTGTRIPPSDADRIFPREECDTLG